MKNILLATLILFTSTHTCMSAEVIDPDLEPKILPNLIKAKKITKKPRGKLRKKPRKRPMIYHHYYTTTIEKNCDRYINIINEKNKEIEALSTEIKHLRENKYEIMRQQLKEEYNKELKKFEEKRKSY
ncbi:hypothetical protein TSL6_17020 [Sulfurovum sp. TSL6]|uniref:hypothetical protein n=1 Tax=Sulfurovum sp. TSL6 TaxID=2826995 RepID=UPI001CC5B447|nr:hypothetical protein [Sulfurovum sp. TSL6]GIU01196.1 hypothetical protein TSL6_17020 [Sulfurovum sp. TSL6]